MRQTWSGGIKDRIQFTGLVLNWIDEKKKKNNNQSINTDDKGNFFFEFFFFFFLNLILTDFNLKKRIFFT